MATDKAAVFIDNSNIFQGMRTFSRSLVREGKL